MTEYVYVLSPKNFDAPICKIGKTINSPYTRCRQINSESSTAGLIWEVAHYWEVDDCDYKEREAHKILAEHRAPRREIFSLYSSSAISQLNIAMLKSRWESEAEYKAKMAKIADDYAKAERERLERERVERERLERERLERERERLERERLERERLERAEAEAREKRERLEERTTAVIMEVEKVKEKYSYKYAGGFKYPEAKEIYGEYAILAQKQAKDSLLGTIAGVIIIFNAILVLLFAGDRTTHQTVEHKPVVIENPAIRALQSGKYDPAEA